MRRLAQVISLGILSSVALTTAASAVPRRSAQYQQLIRPQVQLDRQLQNGVLHSGCPEGQVPSTFEMPIYDDEGLFVVGHETVSTCIPEDLEPAG